MSSSSQENIKDTSRFRRAFLPSKFELLILPAAALLFLTLSNTLTFVRNVQGEVYVFLIDYIELRFRETLNFIDETVGPRILTVIFWMLIGVSVYVSLYFTISALQAYKSDLPKTRGMMLPRGFKQSRALPEAIARICIRVVATAILIFWLYLYFAHILPQASSLFLSAISNFSLMSLLPMFEAALLLAAATFFLIVMARCVVLRERVITS